MWENYAKPEKSKWRVVIRKISVPFQGWLKYVSEIIRGKVCAPFCFKNARLFVASQIYLGAKWWSRAVASISSILVTFTAQISVSVVEGRQREITGERMIGVASIGPDQS